jgi:hypothetical protein
VFPLAGHLIVDQDGRNKATQFQLCLLSIAGSRLGKAAVSTHEEAKKDEKTTDEEL